MNLDLTDDGEYKETAEKGVAIDRKERQRAIVQQFTIDALRAELERRRQ